MGHQHEFELDAWNHSGRGKEAVTGFRYAYQGDRVVLRALCDVCSAVVGVREEGPASGGCRSVYAYEQGISRGMRIDIGVKYQDGAAREEEALSSGKAQGSLRVQCRR